jgi:hypothetical protein
LGKVGWLRVGKGGMVKGWKKVERLWGEKGKG